MIEVNNIHKSFGSLAVLKGVSFFVKKGEAVGLLGESGCGKSTLMKILMGLLKPDRGEILFSGENVSKQMVFQNPYASLDPRLTIGEILREPYTIRGEKNKKELAIKVERLLLNVGLATRFISRLPFQLSGGECQRVAIARALSTEPKLLICDEPVSSLDLITQARMLNLFLDLNKNKGLALLFVSHDRKVIRHLCDRAFEMKDGVLIEADLK